MVPILEDLERTSESGVLNGTVGGTFPHIEQKLFQFS